MPINTCYVYFFCHMITFVLLLCIKLFGRGHDSICSIPCSKLRQISWRCWHLLFAAVHPTGSLKSCEQAQRSRSAHSESGSRFWWRGWNERWEHATQQVQGKVIMKYSKQIVNGPLGPDNNQLMDENNCFKTNKYPKNDNADLTRWCSHLHFSYNEMALLNYWELLKKALWLLHSPK